jgi:hypothetical protein
VIHIILNEEQAFTDLPLLLADPPQTPPNSSDNHGSQNYGGKVLAIGAGGGFSDEQFQQVKDSVKGVEKGVVWVRADVSKISEMPPLSDNEAYGVETGIRVKRKLGELGVGKEDGTKEGVYYFT